MVMSSKSSERIYLGKVKHSANLHAPKGSYIVAHWHAHPSGHKITQKITYGLSREELTGYVLGALSTDADEEPREFINGIPTNQYQPEIALILVDSIPEDEFSRMTKKAGLDRNDSVRLSNLEVQVD